MSTIYFVLTTLVVSYAGLTVSLGAKFEFPPPEIHVYHPKGFTFSIPDRDGVTLFAVHINVNEEFEGGLEAGQIARDIVKKRNGFWTYRNKDIALKSGDTLYFWLYLIKDGLGYQLLDQSYTVTELESPDSIPGTTSTKPTPPPVTPTTPIQDPHCKHGVTTVFGKSVCSNQLIFEEDFNYPNIENKDFLNKWSSVVKFSDAPEAEFVAFTKQFNTIKIENGNLIITPQPLDEVTNTSFITTGQLRLTGCTSSDKKHCERSAYSWSILPPVVTSRITSRRSLNFAYGKVEVRAKLPKGDWIVPEIWLEPSENFYGANSGQIFLGHVLGNENLVQEGKNDPQIGQSILRQGYRINVNVERFFRKSNFKSIPWGNDFHTYRLEWTQKWLKFFVDDKLMGTEEPFGTPLLSHMDEGQNVAALLAPFDREFFISLGVHAGGRTDFPDVEAKPWQNNELKNRLKFWQNEKKWRPTWTKDSSLIVDFIKVTSF